MTGRVMFMSHRFLIPQNSRWTSSNRYRDNSAIVRSVTARWMRWTQHRGNRVPHQDHRKTRANGCFGGVEKRESRGAIRTRLVPGRGSAIKEMSRFQGRKLCIRRVKRPMDCLLRGNVFGEDRVIPGTSPDRFGEDGSPVAGATAPDHLRPPGSRRGGTVVERFAVRLSS